MKKIIIYLFFVVFLISMFYLLFFLIIEKHDEWILGDWVINYHDGGFKRRGLAGSLLLEINKLFQFNIDYQVFIFNSLLWFFYLFFFYKLIKRIKITWGLFFLILSPVLFLFNISSTSSIGRKEIIIFFLFSLWIYQSIYNNIKREKDFYILILLSLSCFIHELVIFYSPYFFLFYFIKNKKIDFYFLFALLFIIINILSIYFLGGEINQGNTLKILKSCDLLMKGNGILNEKNDTSYLFFFLSKPYAYISYFIIYFLYLLFSLKIFANCIDKTKIDYKRTFFLIILCQLCIFPLFYLATDWGRWININFTLLTLIILYFMNKFKLNREDIFNNYYFKLIGFLFLFLQIETCCLGIKLNYYLEILISKIK